MQGMAEPGAPIPFELPTGAVRLAGEAEGEGPVVVLLHGLTATRRYVVHGSRVLARRGYRVIAYDARGHGASSPPPEPTGYEYRDQVADLAALLDGQEVERAVLAGHSMGAATATAFALAHPERVAALVEITPAYAGEPSGAGDLAGWDRLAAGLRSGGVDGFLAAYDPPVEERFREPVMRFTRQRLERHRDPSALADALEVVPRSVAFEGLDALAAIEAPALVVGSRDGPDPGHPLAVARAYAERMPSGELAEDGPDAAPLAWRGAQLSRRIAAFLEGVGIAP